jgi:hypothetical protein
MGRVTKSVYEKMAQNEFISFFCKKNLYAFIFTCSEVAQNLGYLCHFQANCPNLSML